MNPDTNGQNVVECGLNDQYMKEIEVAFKRLRDNGGVTGIIYSQFHDTLTRSNFSGRDAVEECPRKVFLQALFELQNSCTARAGLGDFKGLSAKANKADLGDAIPLAMARIRYDVFSNRVARIVGKQMLNKPQSLGLDKLDPRDVLQDRECFMAAPLSERTYRGKTVVFKWGEDQFLTNSSAKLRQLKIDFGDGLGSRTVSTEGFAQIEYKEAGEKHLEIRAGYEDGVLTAKTVFNVMALDSAPTWSGVADIVASEQYRGESISGKYYIRCAPGHLLVTKPAIFIEAFRPQGASTADELYARLQDAGIADALLAAGYDIVILRPTDDLTYIQANGLLLRELLRTLYSPEKIPANGMVFGIGIGALIARYALVKMIRDKEAPRLSHYVSIDGPHKGLNIPPGVQLLISALKIWSEHAKTIHDTLISQALKQTLNASCVVDLSSWPTQDIVIAAARNSERDTLFDELGSLSEITGMAKLAVGNGAWNGVNQGFDPGALMLQCKMHSKSLSGPEMAWFSANALPKTSGDVASMIIHCCQGMPKITGQASGLASFDSSPGACDDYYLSALTTDLRKGTFIVQGNQVFPEVTCPVTKTCMVPSSSAVDYADDGNPCAVCIEKGKSGFEHFFLREGNQAYGSLAAPVSTWLNNRVLNTCREKRVLWQDRTRFYSRIDGLVIPPSVETRAISTWVEVSCAKAGKLNLQLAINGSQMTNVSMSMVDQQTWTSPAMELSADKSIIIVTGSIAAEGSSETQMQVSLCATTYDTGKSIAKQVFTAHHNPTSMFKFLDHTYVKCEDNGATFQCFGGLGPVNEVTRGNAYYGLANSYRNNDSRFTDNAFLGFYLLGGGVCHQAANCFLLSSGQMLTSVVQGYWLSVSFFGFYGQNSTSWFNTVYLPKYEQFIQPHEMRLGAAETSLLQRVLSRRYAWWKNEEEPTVQDIVLEETRMLMQAMPGAKAIDPDDIRPLQLDSLGRVDGIYRKYGAMVASLSSAGNEPSKEMVRKMAEEINAESVSFQVGLQAKLGDRYTGLTGLPLGETTGIVDLSLLQ